MDVPSMIYADPALIDTIVGELKSQGTFDQFRKECINDVDTKPAYQNLHQRVESTVSNYLEGKTWRPDLNKNQLRDSLRKHILEMGFLETGVERIVDQVVNPKVHTVFMPQVEDVVYRVQGIPKPEKKTITNSSSTIGSASKNGGVFNQPPSFLPGLSFLPPALQNHIQKAPTLEDLLPTDLDPVSPESSKDSADEALEESGIIKQHDDSMESQLSGISDLTSHGSDHVAVESENKNDELNEDSHQSKMPCLNKMKSIETEEHFTERDASMSHDEAEQALEETQENLYPSGSVVQYGDQFSMEEEVATTVHNVNTEAPSDANVKNTNFFETGETLNPEKTELEGEENNIDSECAKYPHSCELSSAVVDDNSLAQSDDSQFSGSSDNKLLIDEMKDYNSQSGNSHQPEDERSSMKTSSEGFLSEENSKIMVVENIVEASEEARHGFEDSQDALEKPPLPQTPPVVRDHEDRPPLPPDSGPEVLQRPPLPLTPPLASQHEAILPPLPPPPPPPPSEAMKSTTPPPPKTPPLPQGFGCTGLEPMSTSSTSVIATHETERMNDRTFSPRSTTPTGKYPGIEHPSTPPGAPPVVNRSVECPPLPSTPPLANRPKEQDRPPLPPLPPPADILGVTERPPLPPMPPLAEKANLERPPTPQPTTLNRTPPPLPEEEFSRDSNASLSYEEGAVPKTPRWEPRSPETEKEKPALSDLEQIGIPNPTKMRQSFITSPKNSINCQDEDSQSGSEEMQLAWSPLSNHGDEGNDENGGKRPSEEKLSVEEAPLEDPSPQVKSKEDKGSSSERSRESKKDDELKSESEKHREKDNAKDGRSKERRKEDENDRSRKDSSSSSKRHDDRSSKHRESSSRSKHDDKSRSDKDRDRHSSHHRSDERRRDDRRDDKERSSSSRHKSSRSDDRHRHRDKDQRHGSSSRHEHHDKSSKSEDRSKSSKSHSSDRKDSDRKERESRDKERRMDKEKERSRKDSSRTDEKKRDKERDKDKRDKSSNICRPNNDRKSPDPDVNNGSTFGGNNHGATGSGGGDDHHHDTSNQDSNKGSGSTNTNSKSSDSSQQNNLCSDPPSTSSACNQACPLSSLPLKKRPLLPESEALHEFPCGQQLVLKIKKLKKCDDKPENTKRRKIKALRRLEKEAIRNLTKCPNSSHLVDSGDETSEPLDVSPTKYFESFWPTKSDDKAFLAYVEDLEQSKTLSGLSDLSGSDSEDEEILHSDDSKNPHSGVIGRDIIFSLSLLPDAQALKFPDPNCYDRRQDTKERASKSSNSVKATKRTKQRKPLDSESDTKRHKVLAKEVETPAPTELKSRRARKPNKRYSNDEFTSHFDNEDELDMIEEESVLVPGSSSPQPKESSTSITSASTTSWKDNEKIESVSLPEIDHQKEENKLNIDASRLCTVASKEKPHQSEQVTYSWNKDSYNSNSEDEMDSANTESDLIGTALKNLMMESGLGGPDEASGSQKVPSPPRKTLTNSLSGINTKTIPLSGVKRVGLSRNYKGNKKSSVKPSVAAVSCGQFSLPPSPESDVSASSYEKGAARKLQGSQSDAPELDSNAESNRTGTSRVKQHYSSDDLYKPRPPLRLTSKRSKAVSEQNGSH